MHLTLYVAGEPAKQWALQMPKINWELPIGPQRDLQDAYLNGALSIARAESEQLIWNEPFEFVVEIKSSFPEPKEPKPPYIWLNAESTYVPLSLQNPFAGFNFPSGKQGSP